MVSGLIDDRASTSSFWLKPISVAASSAMSAAFRPRPGDAARGRQAVTMAARPTTASAVTTSRAGGRRRRRRSPHIAGKPQVDGDGEEAEAQDGQDQSDPQQLPSDAPGKGAGHRRYLRWATLPISRPMPKASARMASGRSLICCSMAVTPDWRSKSASSTAL